MLTINDSWKAAFSQAGVEPIVHVKVLDFSSALRTATIVSGEYALTLTPVTRTADVVSGTYVLTLSSGTTSGLREGMTVTGSWVPSGSYIVTVDSSTVITISSQITSTNTGVTYSFSENTSGLEEGMTVAGPGISANSYVVTVDSSTVVTISSPTTSYTNGTYTFGSVYSMCTSNANPTTTSDRIYADPVILSVVPVNISLDVWEREPKIDELSIECLDEGVVRNIGTSAFGSNYMRNREVEVRVGSPELDFADFEVVFRGYVMDVLPSDGVLTLRLQSKYANVVKGHVTKPWAGVHPLQAVKDSLINSGNFTTADIDEDSFDPDHTDNADIGHYCVTAVSSPLGTHMIDMLTYPVGGEAGYRKIMKEGKEALFPHYGGKIKVPLHNIVSEFVRSMYGCLLTRSDGIIKFVPYIATKASSRHFTTDDYSDFSQASNQANVVNKLKFKVGFGDFEGSFTISNQSSIDAYGLEERDMGDFPYAATFAYPYLKEDPSVGGSTVVDDIFQIDETALGLYGGQTHGLSGTRGFLEDTPPTNAGVNSTTPRPLYLLNGTEIIKATTVLSTTSNSTMAVEHLEGRVFIPEYDADGNWVLGIDEVLEVCNGAVVFDMTRGFGGTTPHLITGGGRIYDELLASDGNHQVMREWTKNPLWDITMLYDWGEKILQRHQDGIPLIEFTTSLSHIDIEIGDFITIDSDEFVHQSITSLGNLIKFEVLSKDMSFFGDSVGIRFTCGYVNTSSIAYTLGVNNKPFSHPIKTTGHEASGVLRSRYVWSGLSISAVTGTGNERKVSLASGEAQMGARGLSNNSAIELSDLPLSKDLYIGIGEDGLPVMQVTTLGTDMPPLLPGELRLARVKMDSSGIDSTDGIIDLRNVSPEMTDARNLNILPNNTFNDWPHGPDQPPKGWYYNETTGMFSEKWGQSLDVYQEGRFSLKHKGGTTSTSKAVIASSLFTLDPGVEHTFKVRVFSSLSTSEYNVDLEVFKTPSEDRVSVTTISIAKPVGTASTWVQHTTSVTSSSDYGYARVVIGRSQGADSPNDNTLSADIYFDKVSLEFITSAVSIEQGSLGDLSDVDLTGLGVDNKNALYWDSTANSGAGAWVPKYFALGGHGHILGDLTDVNTSGPSTDEVVRYDSTLNGGAGGYNIGSIPITSLNDVNTSGAGSGEFLKYDGNNWVSSAVTTVGSSSINDLNDVDTTGVEEHQFLRYDGDDWVPSTQDLSNLSDVNEYLGEVESGNFLVWDGAKWALSDGAKWSPSSNLLSIDGIIKLDKKQTPGHSLQTAKLWSEEITDFGADYLFSFDGNLTNKGSAIPAAQVVGLNNGHRIGGPNYTTSSKWGSHALSFSSAPVTNGGDFITIPYSSSLQFEGPFTIDFWVLFDEDGIDPPDGESMCFFSQETIVSTTGGFSGRNPFGLYRFGDTVDEQGHYQGLAKYWTLMLPKYADSNYGFQYIYFEPPSAALVKDIWYHVALTRDSDDTINLSIGGFPLDIASSGNDEIPNLPTSTYNSTGVLSETINPDQRQFCIGRALDRSSVTSGGTTITVNTLSHRLDLNADIDEFRILKGRDYYPLSGSPPGFSIPTGAYIAENTTHFFAMGSDGVKSQLTGRVDESSKIESTWNDLSFVSGRSMLKHGPSVEGVIVGLNAPDITNDDTVLLVDGDLEVTDGNVTVDGGVTANTFVGDGAGLTGLVTSATTAPNNPSEGNQWYDTANNILYIYLKDGATPTPNTAWVDISTAGSGSGTGIKSASSAPTSPTPSSGDMWYDTTNNILYVYLEDAVGNLAWIDISTAGSGSGTGIKSSASAPASPTPSSGDMWYDTTNNVLYVYLEDAVGNLAWIDISTAGGGSGGWTSSESGVVKLSDSADVIELGDEVDASALPTSAPATAGRLWNDSGTLKISS